MSRPRIVVTGASGFVGRHVLDALKEDWRIFGLARRSQARSGAPVHPNIRWFQVDIGDREHLAAAFKSIAADGGAQILLHLAAHYDFSGEDHPEYWRTNVVGLRNVVELARSLGSLRLVFSSSIAACDYPAPGRTLDEASPPDGKHVYSKSKAFGEAIVTAHHNGLRATILRFAALFSDYCEYAPLYSFIETWLSRAWNRSVIGGRGNSAIPYLHIGEATRFIVEVLRQVDRFPPGQVLLGSPDGAVSHAQLFDAATFAASGARRQPLRVPRPLCRPGMWARDIVGRLFGHRPFERPWMADHIDRVLAVDARRTRELLGWSPRPRLEIVRRLPFLLENRKTEPEAWHARNRAALKRVELRPNLLVHRLLERHEEEIAALFTRRLGDASRFPHYAALSDLEHRWNHRLILHQLMSAVRTRERAILAEFCRDLAERRYRQGFAVEEVRGALEELDRICFSVLRADPESGPLLQDMVDHITMTLRFGCDAVEDAFEGFEAGGVGAWRG